MIYFIIYHLAMVDLSSNGASDNSRTNLCHKLYNFFPRCYSYNVNWHSLFIQIYDILKQNSILYYPHTVRYCTLGNFSSKFSILNRFRIKNTCTVPAPSDKLIALWSNVLYSNHVSDFNVLTYVQTYPCTISKKKLFSL